MKKLKERINTRYKEANFIQLPSPDKNILHFKNKFSIHFIFLFEDMLQLDDNWEKNHQFLIKNYLEYDGPRYMEWNYYAVIVVADNSIASTDLNLIRLKIEADISYSRKYVFSAKELDELPPGMISSEKLKSKKIAIQNLLTEWEEALGSKLFGKIVTGPKASLGRRIRSLIEEKIEKK